MFFCAWMQGLHDQSAPNLDLKHVYFIRPYCCVHSEALGAVEEARIPIPKLQNLVFSQFNTNASHFSAPTVNDCGCFWFLDRTDG